MLIYCTIRTMKFIRLCLVACFLLFSTSGFSGESNEPGQVFERYWKTWLSFQNVQELLAFQTQARLAKANKIPSFMRKAALNWGAKNIQKTLQLSEIRTIESEVDGDTAKLLVTAWVKKDFLSGSDQPQFYLGKIKMLREQGIWKIDSEDWNKKSKGSDGSETKNQKQPT